MFAGCNCERLVCSFVYCLRSRWSNRPSFTCCCCNCISDSLKCCCNSMVCCNIFECVNAVFKCVCNIGFAINYYTYQSVVFVGCDSERLRLSRVNGYYTVFISSGDNCSSSYYANSDFIILGISECR